MTSTLRKASIAIALLLGSTAVAFGAATATGDSIVDEAKRRATNKLPAAQAVDNPIVEFRNVTRSAGLGEALNVCGDIREQSSGYWTNFIFVPLRNEVIMEPHAGIDLETAEWYERRCTEIVRNHRIGTVGTTEQKRICEVASMYAEAKYERAEFGLSKLLYCSVD